MYGGGDAPANGFQEWEKAEMLQAWRAAGLKTEGCEEAWPVAAHFSAAYRLPHRPGGGILSKSFAGQTNALLELKCKPVLAMWSKCFILLPEACNTGSVVQSCLLHRTSQFLGPIWNVSFPGGFRLNCGGAKLRQKYQADDESEPRLGALWNSSNPFHWKVLSSLTLRQSVF